MYPAEQMASRHAQNTNENTVAKNWTVERVDYLTAYLHNYATVPFTLVHAGKYRTRLIKNNTTQKKQTRQNTAKQNKTTRAGSVAC